MEAYLGALTRLSIVWTWKIVTHNLFSLSGCETLEGSVIHDNSCHGDKACDKGV